MIHRVQVSHELPFREDLQLKRGMKNAIKIVLPLPLSILQIIVFISKKAWIDHACLMDLNSKAASTLIIQNY